MFGPNSADHIRDRGYLDPIRRIVAFRINGESIALFGYLIEHPVPGVVNKQIIIGLEISAIA